MTNTAPLRPPKAAKRDHEVTHHGITLTDPYAWLRDANYPEVSDPEILAHLESENEWFSNQMAPLEPAVETLFSELKARQPLDDSSVPYRDNGYMYQWRFAEGAQYRTWWRWPADAGDSEDLATCYLDEPALAHDQEFFRLGGLSISPDNRYLAYAIDTNGSERYRLQIVDLETNTTLDERIDNAGATVIWAQDSQTFFYTSLSPQWRPYVAKRHSLGSDPAGAEDVEVYTEHDESTGDHVTSELRVIPSDEPAAEPRLIAAREAHLEYDLDHCGEYFFLLTNDTHKNFRLARTKIAATGREKWETLIEGSDRHYLTDFVCFSNLLVVEERVQGLDQIRLIHMDNGRLDADKIEEASHYIEFPEPTYSAYVGNNLESDCTQLRIGYNSMVTPSTVWDYDVATRELVTRKVQSIPSGYNAQDYCCERRLIEARDGTQVPVSLVRHIRLSLLDRGFVFGIAHIRGGDDMGYHWYEAGKLKERTNTFNDFVDVARGLIEEDLSSAGRLAIAGGSAGGELMGAAVNQAPELWGAVVAHVPFVDVLNTMLDEELPLTPMEWPEWGNPIIDKEAFENILSYSPYDQLKRSDYPPMLVTAGLNDPRVTYWEPAKYVARIRELRTNANRLLLKINMGAGHAGKSGRFEALRETAEEYAFILRELDML